ncbi:hypothetical protein ACQWU4_00015 [Chryseobacterium sp. MIQD13]|uniref:hypothetical protein n=1 Tax=Chryseobacterium sp. MIQD13 TaxID=3422310 RepID=UPI003D26F70C
MKKIVLVLIITLFHSCFSQQKESLMNMNEYLLNNLDSNETKGIEDAIAKYRLLGAKSCKINPEKKYSSVYIEDGFHDEEGFYNGIIILDNKDVCEITNSPYKLNIDSLSYAKVKDGNFVLYTKAISMEDFKKNYANEYFRYEIVIQNKVNELNKCLAIDQYTPKPFIYAKSYYFINKKINNYGVIRIKYSEIKNGINGEIPYLKPDKEKAFLECINNLKILKIQSN